MIFLPIDIALILGPWLIDHGMRILSAIIVLIALITWFPNALFWSIMYFPYELYGRLTNLYPAHLCSIVGLGHYDTDRRINVSNSGWIRSIGLDGVKEWNGSFYGNLPSYPIVTADYYWDYYYHLRRASTMRYYPGIFGFIGLKLKTFSETYFLGYALWTKIGPEPPEDPWGEESGMR